MHFLPTLISITLLCFHSVICLPAPQQHRGKAFDHILQIWLENEDFDNVNKLSTFQSLASQGILLTNYNALTHPSEPNYIASVGGSTFGINNDHYYNIPGDIKSVFDLLEEKGLTWKLYQENIPCQGHTGYKSDDRLYVRKHNPAVSYDAVGLNITRLQNIVDGVDLAQDIQNDALPNWMFYTPNMLNNGHDTNTEYAGEWLSEFYRNVLNNTAFLQKTLVLVTFDETKDRTIRNRVWSLLFGAIPEHLKGTTDDTFYSHYSILSTVEKNWDLGSLGRNDANAALANVFSFVADTLGHENTHGFDVPPMMNDTITGLLTGKSRNQTSTPDTAIEILSLCTAVDSSALEVSH